MATCKRCDGWITWVTTPEGKYLPCNLPLMRGDGMTTLVTEGGRIMPKASAAYKGYVPHWATCPHADEFRKGRKGSNG